MSSQEWLRLVTGGQENCQQQPTIISHRWWTSLTSIQPACDLPTGDVQARSWPWGAYSCHHHTSPAPRSFTTPQPMINPRQNCAEILYILFHSTLFQNCWPYGNNEYHLNQDVSPKDPNDSRSAQWPWILPSLRMRPGSVITDAPVVLDHVPCGATGDTCCTRASHLLGSWFKEPFAGWLVAHLGS